jgi:hypothetical protein
MHASFPHRIRSWLDVFLIFELTGSQMSSCSCPDPLFAHMQAEEERAAAAAKREFFTRALGDLRLTQSKVNRAVVEAQQR